MNRRAFFSALAGAAAFALDPERVLWVPGKKFISIPKPAQLTFYSGPFTFYSGPFRVFPNFDGDINAARVLEALMNYRWMTDPQFRALLGLRGPRGLMESVQSLPVTYLQPRVWKGRVGSGEQP